MQPDDALPPMPPPPQVQMRQQIPPEEVLHRALSDVRINTSDDGEAVALTFVVPAPNKQYTFLIPAEAAKEIGQKLISPHIEVPAGLVVPGDRP